MTLTFEIVDSTGVRVHESGLDRIVVRRREPSHDPGSEVAIYPRHGPLLMQTQPCRVRLHRGDSIRECLAEAGVLEVLDERVTLVVT